MRRHTTADRPCGNRTRLRIRRLAACLLKACLLVAWLPAASLPAVSLPAGAAPAGYQPGEELPGGQTSQGLDRARAALSAPLATLPFDDRLDFHVGAALFRKIWVPSPSSTTASDGLGPLFNARSCESCHRANGRGAPPAGDVRAVSLFLRLSRPATARQRAQMDAGRLANVPDPVYGGQLQTFAVQNVPAEARLGLVYNERPVRLADGTVVKLRVPHYSLREPGYGTPSPDLQLSPRVAPPVSGLGLLDAVPAQTILAWADPDDRDGDGISGRANRVWSTREQRVMLGRFGWKAGMPTLADQNDSALAHDIGIGNALFPSPYGDCTATQTACLTAANGNTPAQDNLEAAAKLTEMILFYSRHLAPPPRPRARDPQVLAGKALFHRAGCAACHRPSMRTGADAEPALASRAIWPYSDLLLHDMGPGLADDHREYRAHGSEWRTAPLWGLGLAKALNPNSGYLHDGRARTLLEAILWHGGEAETARQRVIALPKAERRQLLTFLESL